MLAAGITSCKRDMRENDICPSVGCHRVLLVEAEKQVVLMEEGKAKDVEMEEVWSRYRSFF